MTETTTVTVLFTDVVGSTSLRQHQGETTAQAIMNAHNKIVRQQIGEHSGQEVKTSGDSFMVAFDSARRAVECAVGVQRALRNYNRRHPVHPVKVRIGLHTGEAIRDGHDLFGTSVDAAARIMAKADGEQILVSDILKAVLGASKDFGFKNPKRVRLKGFAEGWRLWEVAWRSEAEAVTSEAAVAAGAASAAGRTPYVGRVEEQALLRQAVDRALGGIGGVVLIAGEAGLGKTRLVDEIAVEARARGMFVVRGQCYDMEGAPPYAPFVEAIEYGLNVVPRDTFRMAMGEAGPEIARFVPKVRVAYPDLPPPVALPTDQARHYMFESVCDFFEHSAAIQPMLIVLEDLHWADESTTQLLESVARRIERAALLVLGTYRDVDLGPHDPFIRGIEHLSRLAAVSRIMLKRLSAGEVGDILRALSGREPPERLVRLVYDETEGVPLFVEEVYRHLAEERRLTNTAGNWLPEAEIGEIEVPETVRLVLGRRIDRIAETAQRIMTTAACIGRTFTFEFLAALAEESEDDLLDALDEAERVRLVVAEHRREPRLVFAHEQIRQTFLSRLSFVRRQRLHGRVADTMERVYAGHLDERVSDLAYHLIQAGARERAATYLHQAGSSAAARLATPEALAFFARAAELAGPGPTRRAALRARGELLLGLFRGREATVDLELAMREAATEGAAAEEMEALLRLGRAYYVVALDYGPAIDHSRHALERAHQLAVQLGDRRAEALALMTRRHFDLPALSAAYEPLRRSGSSDASVDPGFHSQAAANAERALAIARELGDEDLEVDALRAASRIGTTAARLENLDRIALSLERRGDLIALNEHLFDSMWAYWLGGRFADCVTCSDRATALAGRLGIPPVQYGTIKSFALVDLGRFDEAWQALEQEVADDDHPFGQAFQLLGQTWWYLASGDVERVLRDVPRVLADARELKRGWMVRWAERMLEAAMVATQPDGTSVAALKAAVEAAGGRLTRDGLVTAQLLAGNADAALAECERSLPQLDAEGRGRPYWTTEESRARALLALDRFTEVCQAVDSALAVVMPLGWRSLAWRLRASQAVALAGLGDRTAGEAERQAAVDILMTVAGTLHDAAARTRFLSGPAAASLLA